MEFSLLQQGRIYNDGGKWVIVTRINYTDLTMKFEMFYSLEAALKYLHDAAASVYRNEVHRLDCPFCKGEK